MLRLLSSISIQPFIQKNSLLQTSEQDICYVLASKHITTCCCAFSTSKASNICKSLHTGLQRQALVFFTLLHVGCHAHPWTSKCLAVQHSQSFEARLGSFVTSRYAPDLVQRCSACLQDQQLLSVFAMTAACLARTTPYGTHAVKYGKSVPSNQ